MFCTKRSQLTLLLKPHQNTIQPRLEVHFLDGLLGVDVINPQEPIEAGDGEKRFVSQTGNASNRADAALVLPEHAAMLRTEVVQSQTSGTGSDQNLE